jgi:DNA-binding SARP family transcriptional activator/tetratricopeptide (TPR) repeat protein
VEFRLFGDVEILAAGQRVAAGHARQRSVLAVLLLELGRLVPADQLIGRVWGENPPASVRNVLYGYVARLRAAIAAAGDPSVTLGRRPGGYLLEAGQERVDLYRFRRLMAAAGAAAGDDGRAGPLLTSALELWRGPALAGLNSPWLGAIRDALELERIAAVLDLADIELRQGQHGALAGSLAEEAVNYPADERLIGQLMLALYRSGRQAEALRWFEQTRRRLAEEFGADPGAELRALHQRILRADRALAAPGPTARGAATAGTDVAVSRPAGIAGNPEPGPRELPADVVAFTGRAAELAELDRFLAPGGAAAAGAGGLAGDGAGDAAAAVISAVSGTAGVGKTALAVHWAHRAAARFPDGQLYVNLRGYDPDRPVTAADALAGFLRALGVAGQDIPAGEGERAARYRSLLAGRRVLILADNAAEVAQVRPLLPATAGCVMVVTSRDSLAGLVARDGARRLDLDLLPRGDAVGLLRELIGARVDADPGAAAALAEHCARLPLALRVAAELAVARPDVPLAGLAGELADQQSRLDLLDAGGDPSTAVRAVFSWSYQHLDPAAARAFRLLGLHPGPGFEPYAAAALTGAGAVEARRLLDQLVRAHLIQPAGPGRYTMHDLLRAYAAELAAGHDSDGERRAALTRLFDHYLHTAAAAMDSVFSAEHQHRPRIGRPPTPIPPVADPAAARAWLDAQLAVLVAAAGQAAGRGLPGYATGLAATLFRYLDNGGHLAEAITIHTCARDAARLAGDRTGEANALISLGIIDAKQGRYQQATGHFEEALASFRDTGDLAGEARVQNNLGLAMLAQGHYQHAAGHFERALALCGDTGDLAGQAYALGNLGVIHRRQGRYEQATSYQERSLALSREIGDPAAVAEALIRLGLVGWQLKRYDQAAGQVRQALEAFRHVGDPSGEARALSYLGRIEQEQGRYSEALGHERQALELFREYGERAGEVMALNGLGEALCAMGRPGDARAQHAAALELAVQIGEKYEQANAHNGLGRAYSATGDSGQARHHWQEALTLYAHLGAPQADQVRTDLAANGNHEHRQS